MGKLVHAVGRDNVTATYNLDQCQRIGDGGQGSVYTIGSDQCFKVMYDIPTTQEGLSIMERIWKNHDALYADLRGTAATVPHWLLYDNADGRLVGYGMEYLRGWLTLADILSPRGAREHGVGRSEVASIFTALHTALGRIHAQGFIVGDLNASNIMFRKAANGYEVRVTDVDTWSVKRPDLGLDVESAILDASVVSPDYHRALRDGRTPHPKTDNDWWAYSRLLYRVLLKHDPFGEGLYFNCSPSQRIMKGITARSPGVRLSSHAQAAIRDADPTLLDALEKHLRMSTTGLFPLNLLEPPPITTANPRPPTSVNLLRGMPQKFWRADGMRFSSTQEEKVFYVRKLEEARASRRSDAVEGYFRIVQEYR